MSSESDPFVRNAQQPCELEILPCKFQQSGLFTFFYYFQILHDLHKHYKPPLHTLQMMACV